MNDSIQRMLDQIQIGLPPMAKIRQRFDDSRLDDPVAEITEQFHQDWVLSELDEIRVPPALFDEIRNISGITLLEPPSPFYFNVNGDLVTIP